MSPAQLTRRAFMLGAAAAIPALARSNTKDSSSLRVSATPSIFRSLFKDLSREFERRYPGCPVELTVNARTQDDQIQGTLRDALIDNLPDVSFQGLNYLRLLYQRRIAVPLDDLIAKDPEWNNVRYASAVSDGGCVAGAVAGLSAAVSVPVVYYDIDRVAAVWGSRPMPQDWPSMLALVDALGRNAKGRTLGAFCQHDPNNWFYWALVQSLGGSMMSSDERRVTLGQDPAIGALDIYRAFGRAGQARADMDSDPARQAFTGGGIALLIDSSSALSTHETQIDGRFRLGTSRLPLAAAGTLPPSGIALILHTRNPARMQAAWAYMKFVAGPEGQTLIGRSTGYIPANDLVIRRTDGLAGYYEARPLFQPVIASLPFMTRWLGFPGRNAPQIDSVIFDGLTDVIALSKTPAQAAAEMTRSVEALL
jgi:multiple sugar transport system substrate-binding protein